MENREEIEETVVSFFTALFNGHHNSDLVDTGASFEPNFDQLDSYLDGLGSRLTMLKMI